MTQRIWSVGVFAAMFALPSLPAWAEPKAPTGLTATYTAPDTVTLDWDDTPGATEYWVFRVDNIGGMDNFPIPYDKYGTYAGYGYYSMFSVLGTTGNGAPSVGSDAWRYLGSASASNFTNTYAYTYRFYGTYSGYSYRNNGGVGYLGYRTYVPYGSYFVMAVDSSGKAGLPSGEAVAFASGESGNYLRAPENVKVTPGPGNAYVVVSWDSVSGATLYRVLGKGPSLGFVPSNPAYLRPIGGQSSTQNNYWRYTDYMYATYAPYSVFKHYYGDVTGSSYVVYSIYGAYLGYPLYDAYIPYGVYKVVAMKQSGDVMSPASAESRVVPPGVTDISGSTGILTSTSDTLTISNVSTEVNGTSVTCPAGSLSTNTVLTISVQTSGTAFNTALPESLSTIGSIIDFDIGSATVTGTLTITLPVPSGYSPSAMRIWHWRNNAWTEETTGRVNGASTVSFTVTSLSPFALGAVVGSGTAAGGSSGGGCFLETARR